MFGLNLARKQEVVEDAAVGLLDNIVRLKNDLSAATKERTLDVKDEVVSRVTADLDAISTRLLAARESAKAALDSVDGNVHEYPYAYIGAAAAVGVLVGLLLPFRLDQYVRRPVVRRRRTAGA